MKINVNVHCANRADTNATVDVKARKLSKKILDDVTRELVLHHSTPEMKNEVENDIHEGDTWSGSYFGKLYKTKSSTDRQTFVAHYCYGIRVTLTVAG